MAVAARARAQCQATGLPRAASRRAHGRDGSTRAPRAPGGARTMRSAGRPAAAWSATFASAPRSAMNVYADVMVPRIFGPWGHELLGELGLAPGEAVLAVAL